LRISEKNSESFKKSENHFAEIIGKNNLDNDFERVRYEAFED